MLKSIQKTKTNISQKTNTKILICKVPQKMHTVDKIIEIHLKMGKNNSKATKRNKEEKQYEIWIDEECINELKDVAKEGNLILRFEGDSIRKYKKPKTKIIFSVNQEKQEYKFCKYRLEKLTSSGLYYDNKSQNGTKKIIFILIKEKLTILHNIFVNKIKA